jgi:hypothetical protein
MGIANYTVWTVTVTVWKKAVDVSPVKLITALRWSYYIIRRGRTLCVTTTRHVADAHALRVCKTVILAFLEPSLSVERPVEVSMSSITGESLVKLGRFTLRIVTIFKSLSEKVLSR